MWLSGELQAVVHMSLVRRSGVLVSTSLLMPGATVMYMISLHP